MDTNTNDKTVESPGEWGIVMIYGRQPPQEKHRESEVYGPYKPASASVLQAAAGLYSHTTQGLPSCLVLLTKLPIHPLSVQIWSHCSPLPDVCRWSPTP